jgi:hypothetical protein
MVAKRDNLRKGKWTVRTLPFVPADDPSGPSQGYKGK